MDSEEEHLFGDVLAEVDLEPGSDSSESEMEESDNDE